MRFALNYTDLNRSESYGTRLIKVTKMCLLNLNLIKMFNNGVFFFWQPLDFQYTVSAFRKNTYRSLSLVIKHANFTFTTFSRIPYPDELTEVLSVDL